uniref:Uncharacterized protein n=1 Tax=Oryctolagus cuniculus TaxID=9986 RepID=G1TVD3_RABIT
PPAGLSSLPAAGVVLDPARPGLLRLGAHHHRELVASGVPANSGRDGRPHGAGCQLDWHGDGAGDPASRAHRTAGEGAAPAAPTALPRAAGQQAPVPRARARAGGEARDAVPAHGLRPGLPQREPGLHRRVLGHAERARLRAAPRAAGAPPPQPPKTACAAPGPRACPGQWRAGVGAGPPARASPPAPFQPLSRHAWLLGPKSPLPTPPPPKPGVAAAGCLPAAPRPWRIPHCHPFLCRCPDRACPSQRLTTVPQSLQPIKGTGLHRSGRARSGERGAFLGPPQGHVRPGPLGRRPESLPGGARGGSVGWVSPAMGCACLQPPQTPRWGARGGEGHRQPGWGLRLELSRRETPITPHVLERDPERPEAAGSVGGSTMEEKPFKVSVKPQERRSSGRASPQDDIRNLWTTATLSQSQLNLPLAELCESFDEGGAVRHAAAAWLESRWELGEQGAAQPDGASVESEALEPELRRESSLESCLEEGDESRTTTESSLVSVPRVSRHTPHRAYWTEQQNRLPLPLVELMENEALEILTKALHSEPPTPPAPAKGYRRDIGREHFLTKELKRYIEGLKRRRSKRFQVSVN